MQHGNIHQFEPGCYSVFTLDHKNIAHYVDSREFSSPNSFSGSFLSLDQNKILSDIYTHIEDAVRKRVDNTDREVACLLSGGLDSSLIAALVNNYYTGNTVLKTFSIGLSG